MEIWNGSEDLRRSIRKDHAAGVWEGRAFHYRNKAQFPVGTDKDGKAVTGFYVGRTHQIIPNTDCALGVSQNQQILEEILSIMREPYPGV